MRTRKIGMMIFSKVLEFDLNDYLRYIQNIESLIPGSRPTKRRKKSVALPEVVKIGGELDTRFKEERFEKQSAIEDDFPDRIACSLRWIKTRNRFSSHILNSLLDYQKEYWLSGKESDIRPLSLKQFLELYPLQYLDASRLSRLLPNLWVWTPQDNIICLRRLFISRRKHHSLLIRDIIDSADRALKDRDIRDILLQRGINLSTRTICNCRKLFGIPNYKGLNQQSYPKSYPLSEYTPLSQKRKRRIPPEPGVYEISVSAKIDYPKQSSNVVYIGASRNLRKRLSAYLGNSIKNARLKEFIEDYETRVRYFLTADCFLHEKRFFNQFIMQYGGLPRANRIGGVA